ncbi:MAG: polysaccharide deacetylase family protein [Bacteroidetes bacterium]|nr:polysaccharide deacetylase family protein [Bacteroidota bacterium]
MLNFKIASLCFVIECITIGLLYYFIGISLWWFLLPIFSFKALIIYGSATIQSNFYTKAHCNAVTDEKLIALTFDDGPNAVYTPKILSILEEFNVPATFFVIGKNILGNESIIKKIDAAGHTIGNHTFSHSFFIDFKSKAGFIDELNTTSDAIYNIIRKRVKFFRPPYGVTTPNLARASKALNYEIIGWNIRSLDTTKDSEEIIAQRVISQVKPGAIILFHDTSEKTTQVLKQTLNFAKENGFKIVSVEELLKLKGYG